MSGTYQYLLDHQNVDHEELLTYLKRRERAYISFLEFCIDKSVFNKKVLIEILKHQDENRTLFIDSMRAIAGNEFADDLVKVYYSQIPSIFRFIENSDKMEAKISIVGSAEVEVEHNEETLQETVEVVFEEFAQDAVIEESFVSEVEPPISWVFPALREEQLDEGLLEDFLETFDEYKRSDMENTTLQLGKLSGDELVNALSFLYRDFHSIKGSARFSHLQVFESLTHELEELISISQNTYESLPIETKYTVEEALLLGIDILWCLRRVLQEKRSERPMSQNTEWLAKVDKMMAALRRAKTHVFEVLQNQTADELYSKF